MEDNIVITDGLIKVLKTHFGSETVQHCDTWDKTCELKGQLKVILWLMDKQEELREAQFENTETITIDSS
jgi:hypothetical protein